MMTTLLRRHPEQNLQRSGFTRIYSFFVMSDHLIYSPNLLLDFANSTLGFRRAFGENSKLVGGKPFSGMITTLFRGHPEQYLRTLACTHHFKSKPSCAEVWALRVLASPSHLQLASLFLMLIRCCASGFRSLKTFLAAPAFCTVFTALAHYPTACGLAVSCPSRLQLLLLSQVWGLSLCNFAGCDSSGKCLCNFTFAVVTDREHELLHLLLLSQSGSLEAATAHPGWSKCSW